MSIRTLTIACVVCVGLRGAVAAPPDHIMTSSNNHVWAAIYPDGDLPHKLNCGALRLQIAPDTTANSAKAKLYVFEKQSAGYAFRETISLTGVFVKLGGVSSHGRVTFTLNSSAASSWPWIIKGTYYTGRGKGNRNDDTIVLRFVPKVLAIGGDDADPCDEAPDEDVLEEMTLPGGGTNPEVSPVLPAPGPMP